MKRFYPKIKELIGYEWVKEDTKIRKRENGIVVRRKERDIKAGLCGTEVIRTLCSLSTRWSNVKVLFKSVPRILVLLGSFIKINGKPTHLSYVRSDPVMET